MHVISSTLTKWTFSFILNSQSFSHTLLHSLTVWVGYSYWIAPGSNTVSSLQPFTKLILFAGDLTTIESGLVSTNNLKVFMYSGLIGVFCSSLKSSQKEQKKLQKTMSSGDLGKMESLRKSFSNTDSRSETRSCWFMFHLPQNAFLTCFVYRVRGKMRFWSKSKHGDKKMSSRGHSADSELTDRRNSASCF